MKKPRHHIKLPTPEHLAHVALYYLSRYASSEKALRKVLEKRMRRASLHDPYFAHDHEKQTELRLAIEMIIDRHKESGALNDKAYAEAKTASLRRQGRSQRDIQARLSRCGVDKDVIRQATASSESDLEPHDVEMKAARELARRRKWGPFRLGPPDPKSLRKEIAAFARAGFSADIVRKVLGSNEGDDMI